MDWSNKDDVAELALATGYAHGALLELERLLSHGMTRASRMRMAGITGEAARKIEAALKMDGQPCVPKQLPR